ncbi:MAG: diguanylate cyclase [Clostridia bacterium]|nr:diguanylate cyclase [Clostridia bacterium]
MADTSNLLAEKLNTLHLLAALDALPDGVLLLDKQGKVIFANQKFTSITGYEKSDLLGNLYEKLLTLLVKQEENKAGSIIRKVIQLLQGTGFSAKIRLYHKKGFTTPVEVIGYPLLPQAKDQFFILVYRELHADLLALITAAINSSLKLQEVLEQTTKTVVDYLDLSSVAIFLKEKDNLHLVSCNAFANEEDLAKVVIPIEQGAPGLIARDKKPIYVANLRTDPLIDDFSRGKHSEKSSIGYPLICKDELLGVIAFDAKTVRDFTQDEKNLFESIANQVAIAVFNAKLYKKLEYLSNTDSLTGLYNVRYFYNSLTQELMRAERNEGFLSILMLDIDFFKNYNDTFGHPAGDLVLKKFSELLLANIRSYDTACRYGGEEFSVILQDCSLDNAIEIAERIRQDVEKYKFAGREKQPSGKLTVSIGISCYPQVKSISGLISSADKALYKAKSLGRNRVECFHD